MIATTLVLLLAGWVAAMAYVYKFRGGARYANLQQYLRNSWPVFALPNAVLYFFTKRWAQGAFVPMDRYTSFANLAHHWEVIRDEALAIQAEGSFEEARRRGSPASFDVGFRTFYTYGWSRYYLNWYCYIYHSASASCPKTLEILAKFPEIKVAMCAVLPSHSLLTPHADPLRCSLRYHLGLATPNADQCFIDVDGTEKAWRDGETFIFDKAYLHFLRNDTDAPRLILMCDVRRAMSFPGRVFNAIYSLLPRLIQTPNDARDQRGIASALFEKVAPVLLRGKQLRERNRPLFKVIKSSINFLLLGAILGAIATALTFLVWMLTA